jgi:hypothetical protein
MADEQKQKNYICHDYSTLEPEGIVFISRSPNIKKHLGQGMIKTSGPGYDYS